MNILLLEKIKNLGKIGDKVQVKPGYARNFLFPRKKAIIANKNNMQIFKNRQEKLKRELLENLKIEKKLAKKVNTLNSVTIFCKVGKNKKLFGSINRKKIVNVFKKSEIFLNKHQIHLPNGVIKSEGLHEIYIKINKKISEKFLINVKNQNLKNK